MIAVDRTLLAFAVNRYAPEHARAARVLEELVNGEHPWALPWPSVHEFLLLVTHPHRVARPLEVREAIGFVEQVLASPSVRALSATDRHASAIGDLAASIGGAGPPPPGLETAAVLREHGVRELLSTDRAMRRFTFLTVIDPLHGAGWSAEDRPTRRYRDWRPRRRA